MKRTLFLLSIISVFVLGAVANNHKAIPETQGIQADTRLNIFPNPVTGNSFQITSFKEIKSVTTTNLLGQKVPVKVQKQNSKKVKVTLSRKTTGIHLVSVLYNDNTKEVKRIIVK